VEDIVELPDNFSVNDFQQELAPEKVKPLQIIWIAMGTGTLFFTAVLLIMPRFKFQVQL